MGFYVDTASRLPIYQQLTQQIREAVVRGSLQPGERLPSVRQLSAELVINPNTVSRAYVELERGGILVSQAGRGMFVAQPGTDLTRSARKRRLAESLVLWLTEAVHLGFTAEEVVELVQEQVAEFQWTAGKGKA